MHLQYIIDIIGIKCGKYSAGLTISGGTLFRDPLVTNNSAQLWKNVGQSGAAPAELFKTWLGHPLNLI